MSGFAWASVRTRIALTALVLTTLLGLVFGCAAHLEPRAGRTVLALEEPAPDDAWTPKIAAWQRRERALPDTEALRPTGSVSGAGAGSGANSARRAPDVNQAMSRVGFSPGSSSSGRHRLAARRAIASDVSSQSTGHGAIFRILLTRNG